MHSAIPSLKPSLFHLIGQSNSQEGRGKVKDGIISVTKLLGTLSVDE